MKEPDANNGGFDGNADDSSQIRWKESDWKAYLDRNDAEIERFMLLYESLEDDASRIDNTAKLMGWESLEITDDDEDDDEAGEDASSSEPYTLHRHPVLIASRALFNLLRRHWMSHMDARTPMDARKAWEIAAHLGSMEQQLALGISSADLGDYALAVCHFKTAVAAVNPALAHMTRATQSMKTPVSTDKSLAQIREILFDLRDVWLRLARDTRTEMRKQSDDSSQD